jgi:hypothetical protein
MTKKTTITISVYSLIGFPINGKKPTHGRDRHLFIIGTRLDEDGLVLTDALIQ